MKGRDESGTVTRLLNEWQQGTPGSFDELFRLIYGEIHRIAEKYLRESPNGTLQPTALVNEAYIHLAGHDATYSGRKHFFALVAQVMRHVLVDRARAHYAAKRGGGAEVVTLDDANSAVENQIEEFLILDQALTRLSSEEPRLAQIIELHYFGGLTGAEIADILGISSSTVSREQRLAAAWLKRALSERR